MIHCRICKRDNEPSATTCECGADLAVDGIVIGGDAEVGSIGSIEAADLPALPELDDLPPLGDLPPLTDTPAAPSAGDPSIALPADEARIESLRAPGEQEVRKPSMRSDPSRAERRHQFAVRPDETTAPVESMPRIETSTSSPGEPKVPVAPIAPAGLSGSVYERDDAAPPVSSPVAGGLDHVRQELRTTRLGPGGSCPTCGRTVEAGRRFCRCGTRLAELDAAAPADDEAPRQTLWRRLTGTGVSRHGDQRTWKQRAKDVGVRKGLRYGTRMSSRTRLGRIALAVLSGAGLIVLLGPLRQTARDLPDLLRADELTEVTSWSPGTCDAPAKDVPENPWLTSWPEDPTTAPENPECPVRDVIEGTFDQPTDVARVTIQIGETSGQTEATRRQPVMSPDRLRIEFTREGNDEPTVVTIDLQDTAARQEFAAQAGGAVSFRVVIDTLQQHSWEELEMVQVAQVAFFEE